MRRTIRLTGRRQLDRKSAAIAIREVGGKKLLTFTFADEKAFKGFPASARLQVRLDENKQLELIDLGTVGSPKTAVELENQNYIDPTCMLRVAKADGENFGVLLGSTGSWRLQSDNPNQNGGVRGLLNFLPGKIAPRTWKLNIDENAHPIIQVDSRIPDPRSWAKSDPVFVGTIMPAVIHQIFDDILCHDNPQDFEWMRDWLQWADGLMTGEPLPEKPDVAERRKWIDALIDSFCQRHKLSDRIVDQLLATGGVQ